MYISVQANYGIPLVIRNLIPKLKERKYFQLRQNLGFLDRKAQVCEDCYLEMMKSYNIYENLQQINKQLGMNKPFEGLGKLKPEVLVERFNVSIFLYIFF